MNRISGDESGRASKPRGPELEYMHVGPAVLVGQAFHEMVLNQGSGYVFVSLNDAKMINHDRGKSDGGTHLNAT